MRRLLLACMALTAVGWMTLQAADDPPANQEALKKIADQIKADLAQQEQVLGGRFRDFELNLLKLKQVLERSDKQEDKDKAVVLAKALDEAKRLGISAKFDQIVETVNKKKFTNPSDVKDLLQDSQDLAEKIRIVRAILGEDSRSLRLAEERRSLEELLKQLEKVIHDQKIVQLKTERGLAKPDDQRKVTEATQNIAKAMDGKNGQGGEAKNNKGNAKPGDTKPGEKNAQAKEQGKTGDSQKGTSKEGGKQGDPKGGKPGEAKPGDPKSGDPKGGDPKSGDPKGGDPKGGKPGEAKSGKGSDAKPGDAKASKGGGDPKSGQAKPGQQGSENKKPGEAKEGGKEDKTPGVREKQKAEAKGDGEKKPGNENKDPKAGEAKAGPKTDPKGSGAKEAKPGQQSKSGDSKSGESKAGDSKPGEAKPGQSSQGQGQPKPGQQNQQAQEKNDPKAPPQQPQSNNQQQQIGKKQIEDAKYPQEEAEKAIGKKDDKTAEKKQQDAIDKLEEAKKKLEQLLAQIREEELERLLANLQRMCIKMRDMQIVVLNGTRDTFKAIQATPDKLPTNIHKQASIKLSDDSETGEKAIVAEADKALMILESEGSAVAFPEVFKQVREDMVNVQRRLGIVDVSPFTQNMEQDIIDTLQEMIDALKKAQKDMKDKKESKKSDPKQGQPQDQKLLEKIAELKMIKSMQIRVNKRTTEYGREYSGEQAADPRIQAELRALSQRQVRIWEATNRIAKGDNK
jgi:mRNA-degrading endonuclease HigB of HigAB toxin-antitoxin module